MSWLLPGFLAGALAIGLPIALHFLRSKPKTVVRFPTLRFLAQSAIRDTRRHRLMRLITLALRCLIIALLAAAFARPFFGNLRAGNGRAVIVAVDNSMSMQARGRWEEARRWALAQLDDLAPGDQAGVLLMQPTPTWLVPVSQDLTRVRTALREMEPGFESTRYMPALHMAAETLAAMPARTKTLVWMADEQRLGWLGAQFNETLPAGVKVRFGDTAPAPQSQAAITSVRWSRENSEPAVEVKTRLFSPEKQTRKIVVKAAGNVIAQQSVALTSGAETTLRIPLKTAPENLRNGLSVSLDADDLPADDTAWLAPLPEASRTILFSPGSGTSSRFLDHALAALQRLDANDLAAKPFPDSDWPAGSVAIATGGCFHPPLLEKLNRFIAANGAVWIVVDGSPEQTRWLAEHGVRVTERPHSSTDEPAHLRDWDVEHPILAAFSGQSLLPLMEIGFERSFSLAGDNLTAVASWPDGTAGLAECAASGGRIFVSGFAFDRSATDWPLQPSFVPFVHATARWLAATSEARTDWRVGDTIPLPPGEGTWREVGNDETRMTNDERAERKVSGAVRATVPGLYESSSDGKTRTLFAVNTPSGESDLAPWPDRNQIIALESKSDARSESAARFAAIKLSDEAAESQQRLWWWLMAVAGAAMLAELAVANRTAL